VILLQHVERGDPIGLAHGGKVEDLLDEKLRGRAAGDRRLPQMHEFGGAFADHLNPQHSGRAALA